MRRHNGVHGAPCSVFAHVGPAPLLKEDFDRESGVTTAPA